MKQVTHVGHITDFVLNMIVEFWYSTLIDYGVSGVSILSSSSNIPLDSRTLLQFIAREQGVI